MIADGAERERGLERRCHTVVVGSGAGGAVVARVLAEAGLEVVVLEEGPRYAGRDFTQRDDEMLPALYRESAQQMSEDGMVNVLQGSCYGGSTVINASDCERTPPAVYAHWRRLVGLREVDEAALAPSVERVEAALGVNTIRGDQVNRNNRLVLEGARRLGLSAGTFRHNRQGCIGSGYCLIGCAYDAKKGAHLNYLPAAVAAGADVYVHARAERIELRRDGRYRLTGHLVERGSRAARRPLAVEAERVVLAAGAAHSPGLLRASGLARGLPQLGRNVSLQPQMSVFAEMPEGEAVVPWRGIPQAAFCDADDDHDAEHGLGGFRLEAVSGGLSQVAQGFPGFGRDHKERMARLRHSALALLLVPDRPSGRITWEAREGRAPRARIRYRFAPEWTERMRRGLRRAAEIYFAAGARAVGFACEDFPPLRSPDELDRALELPVRRGTTRFLSAHVQGSCRMAPDAKRGVVDEEHRVHGHPGIYVVDASVMPTTASTHTMIPIMAMADRAAHRMLERSV